MVTMMSSSNDSNSIVCPKEKNTKHENQCMTAGMSPTESKSVHFEKDFSKHEELERQVDLMTETIRPVDPHRSFELRLKTCRKTIGRFEPEGRSAREEKTKLWLRNKPNWPT